MLWWSRSTEPKYRGNRESYRKVEKVCDRLAAEILMPEDTFRRHMEETVMTLASVQRLAQIFETSVQSAAIRFVDFLPFPAVLTIWKQSGTEELFLKPGWTHRNTHCRPYTYGIQKNKEARYIGPYQAFSSIRPIQTEETLTRTWRENIVGSFPDRRSVDRLKRSTFPTESMAFGSGQNRYVLSLSYVGERYNNSNSLAEEA
ncbi:MAG: Peptidase protein [Dehalococcoidia bacterium]|nr:Peptidase protein [Dehalococcoidia bacterium]